MDDFEFLVMILEISQRDLGVTWDVDLYGELLKIGGGKERCRLYNLKPKLEVINLVLFEMKSK